MTTQSTQEAMVVLKRSYGREIALARQIARELANTNGTGEVTTRDVRKVMADRGLIDENAPEFWLGSVFRGKEFQSVGRHTYSDKTRNIHERNNNVWKLRA